jgi:hypothetical protein
MQTAARDAAAKAGGPLPQIALARRKSETDTENRLERTVRGDEPGNDGKLEALAGAAQSAQGKEGFIFIPKSLASPVKGIAQAGKHIGSS